MKILQINKLYYPWLGGVETHVKELAEELSKDANLSIKVLCCNTKNKTIIETINNIKVIKAASLGIFFSMPISLVFPLLLKKTPTDILHFHLPNPLAVLSYLFFRPKGKIIVTWHSDIIKQKMFLFLYKPFLYWFLKKADRIIVTSPNMAKHSQFLKAYSEKVVSIPLGLVINNYKITDEIKKIGQKIKKNHPKYALFIGRFIYYKGIMTLLKAIKNTNIQLVLIGEGPLHNKMQRYIQSQLKKQVTILPFQPKSELQAWYANCSFFVLPSTHRSEAFGIVQLEAMYYKKTVISTNLKTGVPFVNQHQKTGLVVPPSNSAALKKAMVFLWKNPLKCQKFGESGHKRVLEEFNSKAMVEKIKKIYHN